MDVLKAQVSWWRKSWDDHPLQIILVIALAIRLLAAFFSKGYAFHDDHFDVIKVAQDWIQGIPHWIDDPVPPNHSMFYAAINAGILYVAELIGITGPQAKMTVVRLLHAVYSLLIVYLGYKIALKLSTRGYAVTVGLMLALLWFMPYLGVKNLVEMVCIPPLMGAFYILLKDEVKLTTWLLAGMLMGLAFAFRLHTIIFAGGLGLVMLLKKQ
ncbi:MAG: mannosyltransferase, partial [Fulvivirga sp.]|nr:mannosyltransferase [Fulvivirga sp.]